MALTRLGAVTIVDATSYNSSQGTSYSDDDQIFIYYQDTDESIRAYKNPSDPNDPTADGVVVTSSGLVLPKMVNQLGWCTISATNYSFCDGGDLIKYYKSGSVFWDYAFPYFNRQIEVNSPDCQTIPDDASGVVVCDLINFGVPEVTNATDASTSDGSIYIAVKTTDPCGVQFSLSEFEYGNGLSATRGTIDDNGFYPYTYTFSNLSKGSYTIYAKDYRGCSYVFNKGLRISYDDFYADRYFYDFTDENGLLFRLKLQQKNYSGSEEEIVYGGADPVKLTSVSNGKFESVVGSDLRFTVFSETDEKYTEGLFGSSTESASDKRFIASLYRDPSGVNELEFKGYFVADQYFESYTDDRYDFELTFIDGLGDLRTSLYETTTGDQKAIKTIADCLRTSGLNNKIRVATPIFPSDSYDASGNLTADASTTGLDYVYTNLYSYKGLTKLDVLDSILGSYPKPLEVRSIGDVYWIRPAIPLESSYNYVQYDVNGDYESSGTVDFRQSAGSTSNSNGVIFGDLSRDKTYKSIRVTEDRLIADSVFNPFSRDNIIGDAVNEDIIGEGFVGYTNRRRGDTGNFRVKKILETSGRYVSNVIKATREEVFDYVLRPRKWNTFGLAPLRFLYDQFVEGSNERKELQSVGYETKIRKSQYTNSVLKTESKDYFLSFNISDGQGGNARVESVVDIQSNANDSFEFSFNYFIDIRAVQRPLNGDINYVASPPPYIKLRFSLLLETSDARYFYLNGQDWQETQSEVINEYFVNSYNTIDSLSVTGTMPAYDDNAKLYLNIYDCDPYYYDFTGAPSTYFASLDAANLPEGYRVIGQDGNDAAKRNYYQLVNNNEAAGATGTYSALNNSNALWRYTGTTYFKAFAENPNSEFAVNSISFVTKPNGIEFSEVATSSKSVSSDSLFDLDYPVYHFDLAGVDSNEKGMILNYWKKEDGTPITGWGANNEKSQDLVLIDLTKQYKTARKILTTKLKFSSQYDSTNIILVTYDGNRAYKFTRMTKDFKNKWITGELVEIGTDGVEISVGEYSSAFSSAFDI